jgi:DNA-binding response OmpR family regulator
MSKNEVMVLKHIFVVDDEKNIVDILQKYLRKEGYKVTAFPNGKHVLNEMNRLSPDLIVMDIMMPEIDGLQLCREIRKKTDIPIIFVSARDAELDRVLGLELGGDDYLTKPFSPRELVARIKNIFRRTDMPRKEESLSIGNVQLSPSYRQVQVNECALQLTSKEYELFDFLFRHPKQPFTREQLIESVWGYDYAGDGRLIDDLIKRLRKKLGEHDSSVGISTVWGYGYRLDS